MARAFPFLVCTYLIALAVAAAWVADAAWKSVVGFRPVPALESQLPPGVPLADRVILVVMDGLRADLAHQLPNWKELASRGASGIVETPEPSLSNPARATMTTGASPAVHGVTTNGFGSPPVVESLFSVARRVGVPASAFGSDFWVRAYSDYLRPVQEFEKELHVVDDPRELIEWQQEICDELVPFVSKRRRGLIAAGLTAGDSAGHDFGGVSERYVEVFRAVDRCLGRLVEALDDGHTAFAVVSDHGHIHRRNRGGHGGREPEVRNAPFVFAGAGVRRASKLEGSMQDIAPTIALLLGLPIPANNQGEPIREAIEMSPEADGRVAEQRRLIESTWAGRDSILADERKARRWVSYGLLGWFVLVLIASLFFAGESRLRYIVAIAAFFLVYAALFQVFGLGYSLSAIIREEYTNSFFLRNISAAAIAFLVAAFILRSGERGRKRRRILAAALSITSIYALRASWIYWEEGLIAYGGIPNLQLAFTAYLDLLAALGVASAAVILTAAMVFSGRRPTYTP